MKVLVALLVTISVFLAVGLAYYYGKSTGTQSDAGTTINPLPTNQPERTVEATDKTPSVTKFPTTKKISGGGILSFPKYELTVPIEWEDSREVPGPDTERVVLKRGKYEVSILEGGFGGAACLYPGDPDLEGPSGRYKYFVEIKTKSGDLLRRSWTDGGGFSICQKTQYGWGAPTLFGHIGIVVPDTFSSEVIGQIDEILASFDKI